MGLEPHSTQVKSVQAEKIKVNNTLVFCVSLLHHLYKEVAKTPHRAIYWLLRHLGYDFCSPRHLGVEIFYITPFRVAKTIVWITPFRVHFLG